MSSDTITPVILCGGSGTRLWPRSRKDRPKPFLPLTGERTLFQATLDRCRGEGFADPVVVAGAAHAARVEEQAGDGVTLIVEPAAKNTAPAIGLAAALLPPEAIMLVCPSDHHIADPRAFVAAARAAGRMAEEDWMVAFGIAPDRPETGYGYIRLGEAIDGGGYRVDRFVEKPDRATAERFLAEGGHAWNGGIFAFRAGAFLDELALHRPEMAQAVRRAVGDGRRAERLFHPAAASFASITAESVDYAVMENTRRAAVVPADMGWSDIGNWQALRDVLERDAAGNHAPQGAELVDCRGVLVASDGPRVSVIGLEDVIVVVDGDEVLVTRAADAQKVGKLRGALDQ
ncbi:sugar phosphate nucleotidyltransferase [Tsuneonella sp. YG55]|uniref:Sugar phosphate nucleotidyltransferase n=1 Tax=Tsuneonella litorea TaxID=2976475 RepID=A0A9X2VY74_9SPHN|nr:sugar phosphate nucleotidyltransferase [Tsuneonella litorea]MCT2557480.1 sugar phosphate nucleotidyltransferase [Tsuneonella litorea]